MLVDGIGTWLAAVMDAGRRRDPAPGREKAAAALAEQVDDLVTAWRQTRATVVAVSDQVGSGLVPDTPAGRQFRDQLGWLNQRLAAESEQAVLVVAGGSSTCQHDRIATIHGFGARSTREHPVEL